MDETNDPIKTLEEMIWDIDNNPPPPTPAPLQLGPITSDPVIEVTRHFESGRHVFILVYDYRHDLRPQTIVPKGFTTDLGSIPKALWNIVSPSEIARSAIVHDYLTTGADGIRHTDTPRIEADRFLRDAVREEVGYKTSLAVYAAVRGYSLLSGKR